MNKLIRLLLLPIIIPLWMIGWTMLSIGSHQQRQTQSPRTRKTQKDDPIITIIAIPPEEIEA
jgi:hypothetical protein